MLIRGEALISNFVFKRGALSKVVGGGGAYSREGAYSIKFGNS